MPPANRLSGKNDCEEPRGTELIERYKFNYGIPDEAGITEEMILRHWELEKHLTDELLRSSPENRWEVFEQCYTRLYSELEWLNRWVGADHSVEPAVRFKSWVAAIGSPPQRIYEVGSGRGELIHYLAEYGFNCRGSEITRERGERHLESGSPNLSWGTTDGVHLDRFEPPETYDVVLSTSVVEHLHPDDLAAHLHGAYSILVQRGCYIVCTPHRYTGPHDISRVFGCDEPKGMHLKEYTYGELIKAAKHTGFAHIHKLVPKKIIRAFDVLGITSKERLTRFGDVYLAVQCFVEGMVGRRKLRRTIAKMLQKIKLFDENVCLILEK